jgi:hypothetical protein
VHSCTFKHFASYFSFLLQETHKNLLGATVAGSAPAAGKPVLALVRAPTVFGAQIVGPRAVAVGGLPALALVLARLEHAPVLHLPVGVGPFHGAEHPMRVTVLAVSVRQRDKMIYKNLDKFRCPCNNFPVSGAYTSLT